ncbi:MAG: PorT family protein [Saprospiraceae bacterium]|nr:PorT family protein [Saprospiraceae bacterium]
MENKLNKLILIFCFATPLFLTAQNRFKAGLIVGINAAQINGDNQDGYNKLGLSLGIRGGFDVAETADLTVELFYNNKGAKLTDANAKNNQLFLPNVNIHQADVIIMFNKYLRPKNPEDQAQTMFHIGLSYGRILKTETEVFKRRAAVPQVATFLMIITISKILASLWACRIFLRSVWASV